MTVNDESFRLQVGHGDTSRHEHEEVSNASLRVELEGAELDPPSQTATIE